MALNLDALAGDKKSYEEITLFTLHGKDNKVLKLNETWLNVPLDRAKLLGALVESKKDEKEKKIKVVD